MAKRFDIVILLSTEILDEYKQIPAKVGSCHPLPKFHADFVRNLVRIRRLHVSRKKCTETEQIEPIKFHVIESGKMKQFDVSEFVDDPDDEKFLRVALAEAGRGDVFILSVDSGSLLKLKDDENLYKRLCKKYNQAKNVKVRLPHEFIEIMENPA